MEIQKQPKTEVKVRVFRDKTQEWEEVDVPISILNKLKGMIN